MDTFSSSLNFQIGHQETRDLAIAINTDRFLLRSLVPSDTSEQFLSWIADPEVMSPLNMPARHFTVGQLQAYITGFDNQTRYLVGMFGKRDETLFGILSMDINTTHSFGKMSFLIGHPDYKRIGAFRETAAGLISHMFEVRGLEKIIVHVNAGNEPSMRALEALGFTNEGTLRSHVRSFIGEGRHDQHHYGLLKGELRLPAQLSSRDPSRSGS